MAGRQEDTTTGIEHDDEPTPGRAQPEIFISGTDGFIGRHLKEYFGDRGYRVFGTTFFDKPGTDEYRVDVRRIVSFGQLPGRTFPVVIHTAGIVDQSAPGKHMHAVNVKGTRNMLTWARARGCQHFIHISSIGVYGLRTMGEDRTEERTPRTVGLLAIPYFRTKAAAEREVESAAVPYTMLRLPAVMGRGDSYLTSAILPRLRAGSMFTCGDVDRRISLMYVRNLGPLIDVLIAAGPLFGAYNCASHDLTWQALVAEYARCAGMAPTARRRSILSLPLHIRDKRWALVATFSAFGAHFPSDKLLALLDFTPPHPWQDGVREAVDGFTGE